MTQNPSTTKLVKQRLQMGHHLRAVGSYERAIEQYRAALALDPDCADAYANMAFALQDAGRLPEALEVADEALKIKPRDDFYLYVKGLIASIAGQFGQAQEMLERAIEIDPNVSRYHARLSYALHEQGWHIEALSSAERALELDPQSLGALRAAGIALMSLGRFEEAFLCFEKALQLYPDEAISHAALSYYYKRVQNNKLAIFHSNEALRLDPQTFAVKIVEVETPQQKIRQQKPPHVLNEDISVLISRCWTKMSISQRCFAGVFLIACVCGVSVAALTVLTAYGEILAIGLALGGVSILPLAAFLSAFWRGYNQK